MHAPIMLRIHRDTDILDAGAGLHTERDAVRLPGRRNPAVGRQQYNDRGEDIVLDQDVHGAVDSGCSWRR